MTLQRAIASKFQVSVHRHVRSVLDRPPPADRARFIQAYERLADRQRTVTRMLPGVRQVVVQLAEAKRPALPAGNDLAGAFFGINAGAGEGVVDADKDAASQAEGANGRSQMFARKQ